MPLFDFGSEQDLKDSSEVIAGMRSRAVWACPSGNIIVDDDDHSKQLRDQPTCST